MAWAPRPRHLYIPQEQSREGQTNTDSTGINRVPNSSKHRSIELLGISHISFSNHGSSSSSVAAAGLGFHAHARGGAAPAPAGGDSAFDNNVVIILAALFFAMLFAIGLNSLARCALRYCGGRVGAAAAVAAEGAPARRGSGGIKRSALRSLPVEVYGCGEVIDDVCAICLGEFVDGEKVRVLPRCGHGFHVRCVDAWLVSHGSCPTCRLQVIEGAPRKGGGRTERPAAAETDTIAVIIM